VNEIPENLNISNMELIYHYTSGQHLQQILEKGKLIVSEWEKKNKIKPPALWLSTNPIWENTATKMLERNGELKRLTKEEQHQKFGLIRFVMQKNDTYCSWAKYKHKSNTTLEMYKAMELEGIHSGSNPKEWFASFKNIPLSDCISCEKWDGEKWMPLL
jgi:hypothetical protein